MPAERRGPAQPDGSGRWVHASAVAVEGRGLLVIGPSRSGKSRLALALIGASRPRRPIVLVGDDRILLTPYAGGVMARPHPRIAGFIERRGLGIVASPHRAEAPLAAIVALGSGPAPEPDLPVLALAAIDDAAAASTTVLRWWSALRRGGAGPRAAWRSDVLSKRLELVTQLR